MSNETISKLPADDAPGPDSAKEPEVRIYDRIDRSTLFRPALVLLSSAAVGVVLAPEWATRIYPTDPARIGTPADGDIKADYNDRGDIVDKQMTSKLRSEAVARVRRVYDFDAQLGSRTAERVREAFAAARVLVASRHQAAAPASIEDRLGIELTEADVGRLKTERYSADVAALLGEVISSALSQEIVQNHSALSADEGKGITVRRVPEEGAAQRVIERPSSIPSVDDARAKLPAHFDKVLAVYAERGQRTPLRADRLKGVIVRIASQLFQPSLTFNRRDTEMARADAHIGIKPVTLTVQRGQMIIRDGDVFTERHLLILEHMARYSRDRSDIMVVIGAGLLVLILVFTGLTFRMRWRRGDVLSARDAMFLATLFVLAVGFGRMWLWASDKLEVDYRGIHLDGLVYLLPVAAGAMVARLVLRMEIAMVFAVVGSLVLGLMEDGGRLLTVYALVGSVLGATLLRLISKRGDLLRVGVQVGLAQSLTTLGILLFHGETTVSPYAINMSIAFCGGILSGLVALAITPVVEVLFRYTTDLKLLELGNLNHPALKELIVQAPGTYHHSIIVGSLVEAAAEAIGANALLAKVMAYYHDLGKGCNAMYFIENQRGGHNPHDKLKPSMSAMIIKRHVTDGLEIGERYGLGDKILAGIAEHHGTTLIQYFYMKAKEQEDPDNPVHETDYRYPGRKPQSRETALVMLSDSVEAASRSLSDPTPARLQGLVNKITNTKFTDGQLEECDLTLKDLHLIAKAFMQVLNSIYHHRVEYPEAKKSDGDSDSKPPPSKASTDDKAAEDRPDNIRRLGLTGR